MIEKMVGNSDNSYIITCLEIIGGYLRSQKRVEHSEKQESCNKLCFDFIYTTIISSKIDVII